MNILLIEDNEDDAVFVRETILRGKTNPPKIEWVENLKAGFERISAGGIDAIILDLGLPESKGLKTFELIQEKAANIPIVILSGLEDEKIAVEAVQRGAQDYLVKTRVIGELLSRVVEYSIERKHIEEALRASAKALELKIHELELLNKSMLGREERILALKEEVQNLKAQLQNAPKAA